MEIYQVDLAPSFCGAQIVAYFDIALFVFALLACFYTLSVLSPIPGDIKSYLDNFHPAAWCLVGIGCLLVCFQLWATWLLWKATRKGAAPANAITWCRIWVNLNLMFLALGIGFYIMSGHYIPGMVLAFVTRFTMILVVSKFAREIDP